MKVGRGQKEIGIFCIIPAVNELDVNQHKDLDSKNPHCLGKYCGCSSMDEKIFNSYGLRIKTARVDYVILSKIFGFMMNRR